MRIILVPLILALGLTAADVPAAKAKPPVARGTDRDVVDHGTRSRRLCHPGGGAFVQHDIGLTIPVGSAALHTDGKPVLPDLRSGQLYVDGELIATRDVSYTVYQPK